MKFKIRGVREPGELDKERVVIELLEDGNVGTMIIASTKQQSSTKVSARIKSPYWIPDQEVKRGDLLVIYTKSGSRNSKENNDGTSSYFFYMGESQPLYNKEDQTVAAFDISSWSFAKREALTS